MDKRLEDLDGRLRDALMKPASPALRAACGAATALAFLALLATRALLLLDGAGALTRAATLLLLCAPLCAMLAFALRAAGENRLGALPCLAACAAVAAAMLLRLSFLERSSGDYDIYFADWLAKLGAGTFSEGMRQSIGEYNVLYQYILFLITRLPVPPLYAIKAVSFLGDALLAGALAHLCQRDGRASLAALCAALLLPSAALNGGMFAQCDSLFSACALWGLALALNGKPARAAACFALSLAFKLQAVFALPMVAVLWAGRKLRLSDALVFAGTLLLVALPAMLGGKSPLDIVRIYTAQTGLYTGLTYGAPSFFGLLETAGLDVYAYGNFGMALAVGACALLVGWGMARAQALTARQTVRLAALLALAVFFFLPRMHERYIYLAGALTLACAASERRLIPAAALVETASLACLWEMGLPLGVCSLMVLAAFVWLLACPE